MRKFNSGFSVEGVVILLVFTLVACLLFWALKADAERERQWEAFKKSHACKIVSHVDSNLVTGFGVSTSGRPVITNSTVPAKDGWLCDDGMTYFKDAKR